MRWYSRFLQAEFRRFFIAGTLNTSGSYLIYLWMLLFLTYEVAYTLSTLIAIVISYALNTYYVFRTSWSWKKLAQFPSVYVAQYVVGMASMWILVEFFHVDARIAPWFVVALQVPLTFLLSRRVLVSDVSRLP